MARKKTMQPKQEATIQPPHPNQHIIAPALSQDKKGYLPILHGKATDAFAKMAGKQATENAITKAGTITDGEVKLVIEGFNELSGTLGVSTHKLLSKAVAEFTNLNHTGTGNDREVRQTEVNIPLREYALKCGYDVLEHTKETDEEQTKEAKRAENALKEARKKINRDLAILFSSSISWREKVKGKQADFMDIRLIESKGIRNGYIKITFSQSLANYLILLPLGQYAEALLGVDERNINAYTMGLKMTEHFNNDNNQKKNTAQTLKVKTLLNYTSLPTIETIKKQRASWEARIKEPFEKALDALETCGLLQEWYYCHSKGEALTDKELYKMNYSEWEDMLVHFILKDAPDHTARLQAREEEKIARLQTKKRSTASKKKAVKS